MPSVRVSRAETRLTVHRSPYIRMLCQLVGDFPVERASVKSDVFFVVLRKFLQWVRLGIAKISILIILRLRLELVTYKIDRKMKVSYSGEIFQKIRKWGVEHEHSKNHKKIFKNYNLKLLYEFFERKPGWRFTARLKFTKKCMLLMKTSM